MPAHSKVKGVCIGAGYFSHFHLDAWSRIPEVEITAICDQNPAAARARASEFDIARTFADVEKMLIEERPDFVDIITPPSTHREICRSAAEKGIHILCQKPLALSFADSEKIVAMTRSAGVRFMVNDNWRWQPWYREIKKIMAADVIGEISCAYFQMRMGDGWGEDAYLDRQPFFRDYEKLLIFESGVHFIDTFRFLFGEIEKVYAQLRQINPVIKGEDSAQVLFNFANGINAILDASRYNENETGVDLYTCDPRTTFGIMRLDGFKGHLIMDSCGDIIIKPLGEDSYHHDYAHENRGFAGDSCYLAIRHFIDALLTGEPFETTGPDYLNTLKVVDACYRSAETGQPVQLTY